MTTDFHHLTPKEFKLMPWKNGGGSTTELAIFPREASVQSGFDWRISLADLNGSGPFSKFEGYDRIIAQISGEPMTLAHRQRSQKRLVRFEPYSFAGEWETDCALEGKAQDWNLMVRRGIHASAESLLSSTEAIRKIHEKGTTFLWVAYGSFQVHESLKGHDHRLETHHALEINGSEECVLTIKPREDYSVAILASIKME